MNSGDFRADNRLVSFNNKLDRLNSDMIRRKTETTRRYNGFEVTTSIVSLDVRVTSIKTGTIYKGYIAEDGLIYMCHHQNNSSKAPQSFLKTDKFYNAQNKQVFAAIALEKLVDDDDEIVCD